MPFRLLLLFILINSFSLKAQNPLSDIWFEQKGAKVLINYRLNETEANKTYKISLAVSADGGENFDVKAESLYGDIGSGVSAPGQKTIIWQVLADRNNLSGDKFVFKIEAEAEKPEKQTELLKSYKNKIGMEMLYLKGGTFLAGSPEDVKGRYEDEYLHESTLSHFFISKHEVTVEQYCIFLNQCSPEPIARDGYLFCDDKRIILENKDFIRQEDGHFIPAKKQYKNYPVTGVSWYGANAFAQYLSRETGHRYRLPDEFQWEYAAKSAEKGKNQIWPGCSQADKLSLYAVFDAENPRSTGSKLPNPAGISDLAGNVKEWCDNRYNKDNRSGFLRAIRGGSYLSDANECRSSFRSSHEQAFAAPDIGFRLCRIP